MASSYSAVIACRLFVVVAGWVCGVSLSNINQRLYASSLSLLTAREGITAYDEGVIAYPIGYVRCDIATHPGASSYLLATGQIDVTTAPRASLRLRQWCRKSLRRPEECTVIRAISEYNSAYQICIGRYPGSTPASPGDEVRAAASVPAVFASSVIFSQPTVFKGVPCNPSVPRPQARSISAQRTFQFQTAENPHRTPDNRDVDTVFILNRATIHTC